MDPTSGDDDELLAELAGAVRAADEVPESFVRAGKTAFAWYDVDSELAQLVADSAQAGLGAPGVRSSGAALRTLAFSGGGLTIEVDVHPDALRGQLAPAQAGIVQLRGSSGEALRDIPIDEDGWFVIVPVPVGPFRLSVTAGETTVLTEWVTLD
jgi:hypothetical protein